MALLRELLFQFNSVVMGHLGSPKSSLGGGGPCFFTRETTCLLKLFFNDYSIAAFKLV